MAEGRTDCQTRVMPSKCTGASKSSCRETWLVLAPISDTQKVLLSLSLRLEAECALSEQSSQSAGAKMKRGQNWVLAEQVELTWIVLPSAKFPTGGKHPLLSVHDCCPVAALVVIKTRNTVARIRDEVFREEARLVVCR